MTTAIEIQQLALDVFENKMDYKDNDFICLMALLKESYMRVKGILDDYENEKVEEESGSDADDEEEGVSRYANYDSEEDEDTISYTSSYLSPY
tara:strand:+ start:2059 stop:2337 length:279 start_codon:yes stop_codon:yes gene_type:complete